MLDPIQDPTLFGSGSRQHMVFSLEYWWNSECFLVFWSMKIHQVVQKLIFYILIQIFHPKIIYLGRNWTNFGCYPHFWRWNWPILTKTTHLLLLITFEPWDGFSNFKKVKHSSPIYWIWIPIRKTCFLNMQNLINKSVISSS